MGETGIAGPVLYDARHTDASPLLARCRDFVYVGAQLGHTSPKDHDGSLCPPFCRASIRVMPILLDEPEVVHILKAASIAGHEKLPRYPPPPFS